MAPEIEEALPPSRPQTAWKAKTFQALSYPNYRLLWFGQLGSSASMWMEAVARPWLILQLTGSAVALGLVSASRMIPMLVFGLLAGVIADRFDRRRILLVCQTATTSIHLTTAVLIFTGLIQPWHVYVLSFSMGTSMAFNAPARQAMIPSLVEKGDLMNAIALNTVAMNIMRIVGTALAGVLIFTVDLGNVYLINGILYAWVILMTFMIRVPSNRPPERVRESMWGSLTEGLRYARDNRVALGAISLAVALFLFGLPYASIFIPLFALEVYDIGSWGMGSLMAATGAGALMGALAVATVGHFRHRGRLMIMGVILFGVSLIAFASVSYLHFLPLAYVIIAFIGLMQTSYMAINSTVLLESAPPGMHGRMMSLMSLDRGLIPLGAMIAAFLAASVGPQTGLMIFGGLCILTASAIAILIPSVRSID